MEEFWLWVSGWAGGGVGAASGIVATRGRAGVGSGCWGAGEVWTGVGGVGETSAGEARVREVGAGVEGAGAEITGDAEDGRTVGWL